MTKAFDTNIGSGHVNLTIPQALVELIVNSLEEGILSQTDYLDIKFEENGLLHIVDKGRGIPMKALVFSPNPEKTENSGILGQFGSGLKDAIATLYEKGVSIIIKTNTKDISFKFSAKFGYSDIKTLHAVEETPSDPNIDGTEIILTNISLSDLESAKSHFLSFTKEKVLTTTLTGEIIEKIDTIAKIYYQGTQIAKQDKYLFSYNITEKDPKIKKALTRDKRNLSSNAYSRTVGKILKQCDNDIVLKLMLNEFKNKSDLEMSKDICKIEVQEHLAKILHANEKIVYLTPKETAKQPRISEIVEEMGYNYIHISDKLKKKISGKNDLNNEPIRDYKKIKDLYNRSFQFNIVPSDQFDRKEKRVYRHTPDIIALLDIDPSLIKSLAISETMRVKFDKKWDTDGIADIDNKEITIKRSVLKRGVAQYSGVLGHEIAHITSKNQDISRGFELELTRLLGIVIEKALKIQNEFKSFKNKQES